MKEVILCFLLFAIGSCSASLKSIQCERIAEEGWWPFPTWTACYMDGTTEINSRDFFITPPDDDTTVEILRFSKNKKIRFLPEVKFPLLTSYYAGWCSVESIDRLNFRGLRKLKELRLQNNAIEKIETNTFEDLPSLKYLSLHDNNIKFMNGAAFNRLSKLKLIYLAGNICINENFKDQNQITALSRVVSEKCAFCEAEPCTSQVVKIGQGFEDELETAGNPENHDETFDELKKKMESEMPDIL